MFLKGFFPFKKKKKHTHQETTKPLESKTETLKMEEVHLLMRNK